MVMLTGCVLVAGVVVVPAVVVLVLLHAESAETAASVSELKTQAGRRVHRMR
jgi:hypothetical protein